MMRGEVRVGRWEGRGRWRRNQRAGAGLTIGWGAQARGGAHVEHVAHVRDAGGVEAQRLVERRRALPRVERRAYDVGRGAGYRERPEAAGDRGARGVQGRPRLCRLGAGHGEERTENM